MKINAKRFVAVWLLLPLPLVAQTPAVITMDQEPHHHLALQNDFAKVFKLEVSPGDLIVLHRHDQDTVAIAIGDQLVTVGIPGKPDVQQKNADSQIRLQRGGYVHSTRVDGDTPYHTVAVELLRPQTNYRNLCAEIVLGLPHDCPAPPRRDTTGYSEVPLLRSDQTYVRFMSAAPHQSVNLAELSMAEGAAQVIVALDAGWISMGSAKDQAKALKAGDFEWIDGAHGPPRAYENRTGKMTRFIEILFPQAGSDHPIN